MDILRDRIREIPPHMGHLLILDETRDIVLCLFPEERRENVYDKYKDLMNHITYGLPAMYHIAVLEGEKNEVSIFKYRSDPIAKIILCHSKGRYFTYCDVRLLPNWIFPLKKGKDGWLVPNTQENIDCAIENFNKSILIKNP